MPALQTTAIAAALQSMLSAVHILVRVHSNHDEWSETTQSCSASLTVIIYMTYCGDPVMTDWTPAGGHEPIITHFLCTSQAHGKCSQLSFVKYVHQLSNSHYAVVIRL